MAKAKSTEESTALTTREQVPLTPMSLNDLGSVLSKSGFFADSKQANQAMTKVLAGRELGIGPISAMTGINIIKGKVSLSANLIAGCIKRSGRYNYRITELTDVKCVLDFTENNQPCGQSTFTIEDAKRAGISSDMYRKFPQNMLFARAVSNGAKWFCPDIFGGPVYTPDELGATTDEDGDAITVEVVQVETEEEHVARLAKQRADAAAKQAEIDAAKANNDATAKQVAEAKAKADAALAASKAEGDRLVKTAEGDHATARDVAAEVQEKQTTARQEPVETKATATAEAPSIYATRTQGLEVVELCKTLFGEQVKEKLIALLGKANVAKVSELTRQDCLLLITKLQAAVARRAIKSGDSKVPFDIPPGDNPVGRMAGE